MRPQTFNRSEKKPAKLTKQEKTYNAVQKMKRLAEGQKKEASS